MERSRLGLRLIATGTALLVVAAFVDVVRVISLHTFAEYDAAYAMSVLALSFAAGGFWIWSSALGAGDRPPLRLRSALRCLAGAAALLAVGEFIFAIAGSAHQESGYFLTRWSVATVGYLLVAAGWWTWGEAVGAAHATGSAVPPGAGPG